MHSFHGILVSISIIKLRELVRLKQEIYIYIGALIQPSKFLEQNVINAPICSVAARKVSSKFHAKVSRNFWHESLNLFEETFP